METWMFYSYKGGSGRTVASANVAAALAKLGKRVLIIDMDFEAPGLHVVFQVEDTEKFKNRQGIQDYFRGNINIEVVRKDLIIDLASEEGLKEQFDIPKDACFLYLMASPRTSVVFTGESELHSKMEELIHYLGEELKLDYVILDAASGIREAFTISIKACDKLMMFFRWSLQHLEGTLRVIKLLDIMKDVKDEKEGIWRPYRLVASAAPSEGDLESLDNKVLSRALKGVKVKGLKRLQEESGETIESTFEIPEIIELKWQEAVIVFNRDDTSFEELAKSMMI